jgi:hypothetical protein
MCPDTAGVEPPGSHPNDTGRRHDGHARERRPDRVAAEAWKELSRELHVTAVESCMLHLLHIYKYTLHNRIRCCVGRGVQRV